VKNDELGISNFVRIIFIVLAILALLTIMFSGGHPLNPYYFPVY
jgi:hypothetical protein